MRRAFVLVEGQTEELFVREVLAPYLRDVSGQGTWLEPVLIKTKRLKEGGHFRGGVGRYAQVRGDLAELLKDSSAPFVSTFIDLSGRPDDFPGNPLPPGLGPAAKVAHVEAAFAADINHPRFVPHLALHEFETFLFVDPAHLRDTVLPASVVAQLERIRAPFGDDIERINDGADTRPSKRVLQVFPAYEKVFQGGLACAVLGLERLRAGCPHFHAWVTQLETRARG